MNTNDEWHVDVDGELTEEQARALYDFALEVWMNDQKTADGLTVTVNLVGADGELTDDAVDALAQLVLALSEDERTDDDQQTEPADLR